MADFKPHRFILINSTIHNLIQSTNEDCLIINKKSSSLICLLLVIDNLLDRMILLWVWTYIVVVLSMQEVAGVSRNKTDKSITLMPAHPYFSLIWLHGLGDSSEGFLPFFQMPQSPLSHGGRVRLLNAPLRKVTINYGGISTSWYDILDLSPNANASDRFDLTQVRESLEIIDREVASEIAFWRARGVQGTDEEISKRIFIGGFSQGCAMSLCYGLTSKRLLGGVIGYSGHLFEGLQFRNVEKLPMLVYHGDSDIVLNYQWVRPSYEKYLVPHPNFQFTLVKKLPHSVITRQLVESTAWILKQLEKGGIKAK